jgi:hypothetical protein
MTHEKIEKYTPYIHSVMSRVAQKAAEDTPHWDWRAAITLRERAVFVENGKFYPDRRGGTLDDMHTELYDEFKADGKDKPFLIVTPEMRADTMRMAADLLDVMWAEEIAERR